MISDKGFAAKPQKNTTGPLVPLQFPDNRPGTVVIAALNPLSCPFPVHF
jgi:hypothetical protein